MKEVHKKSTDTAVNKMIIEAYRRQVDLVWDRAEGSQPQCGFGRLAICCTDCFNGPCRVNPFSKDEQKTICGRDGQALVLSHFTKKVASGVISLAQLATEFGAHVESSVWQTAATSADAMLSYPNCLSGLGASVVEILTAISKAQQHTAKKSAANLGVLENGSPNIVMYGPVASSLVEKVVKAAEESSINVVGIVGNEKNIPVVTNYVSQETPLFTGAVDVLVLGSQCVMPSVWTLANELFIPVVSATELTEEAGVKKVIRLAQDSFNRRRDKDTNIPVVKEEAYIGYEDIRTSNGLVYLGGCGNAANTQDVAIVKTASLLIQSGFTVITAGCTGTSLAKAGMCKPGGVINVGSCHDAGEFFVLADAAKKSGLPVYAVISEVAHTKTLATAIGFASIGIATFIGGGEITLPEGVLDGKLTTFADFRQLPEMMAQSGAKPETLAEVAAAK